MSIYRILAFRNIWRNKRRTIITMATVCLAVFLAVLMRSWQNGTYQKMVEDVVTNSCGYLQIHAKGYWDDKTINNSFMRTDSLDDLLSTTASIRSGRSRIEGFALACSRSSCKGVGVAGIDPEHEKLFTGQGDRIIKGSRLHPDDPGVLMSEKLAEFLKMGVGDTLVLLAQGFHGVSAADQFPVKGIVHFASPQLNSRMVYATLSTCQQFYNAPGRITSLVLGLDHPGQLDEIKAALQKRLDAKRFELLDWRDMLPELRQQIQADNAGGLIMLGILYLIAGFGILSTLLMMAIERKKEFGVMIAIGAKKVHLVRMMIWESIILAVISIAAGVLASLPLAYYFYKHPVRLSGQLARSIENFGFAPILPFAFDAFLFMHQAVTVLLVTLLAMLIPLAMLLRLNVVRALKE